MSRLVEPGIYTMTAADYHADPCPEPSLSSSIAKELLGASPKHAWWASSRLNPNHEREEKDAFDLGTACHAYLLEGETGFVIIDAKDFRTNAAKEQRDAARAAGKTPLLAYRWEDVKTMARTLRGQLDGHGDKPVPFTAGKPEQTLIWRQGGIWCRARLDWLHDDRRMIDDLKTTDGSANPERWIRGPLYGLGYDIQAAFYISGIKAVFGIEAAFRFVVQEVYPPFAASVIGLAPAAVALANEKVAHAIALWRECQRTGIYPGYPTRTCWAELPPWEETRWLERRAFDTWARGLEDDGRPLDAQLNRD